MLRLSQCQVMPSWFSPSTVYLQLLFPFAAWNFYQSRNFAGANWTRAPLPYMPQCDALGQWEPVQCYAQTGELNSHKMMVVVSNGIASLFAFGGKNPLSLVPVRGHLEGAGQWLAPGPVCRLVYHGSSKFVSDQGQVGGCWEARRLRNDHRPL